MRIGGTCPSYVSEDVLWHQDKPISSQLLTYFTQSLGSISRVLSCEEKCILKCIILTCGRCWPKIPSLFQETRLLQREGAFSNDLRHNGRLQARCWKHPEVAA